MARAIVKVDLRCTAYACCIPRRRRGRGEPTRVFRTEPVAGPRLAHMHRLPSQVVFTNDRDVARTVFAMHDGCAAHEQGDLPHATRASQRAANDARRAGMCAGHSERRALLRHAACRTKQPNTRAPLARSRLRVPNKLLHVKRDGARRDLRRLERVWLHFSLWEADTRDTNNTRGLSITASR